MERPAGDDAQTVRAPQATNAPPRSVITKPDPVASARMDRLLLGYIVAVHAALVAVLSTSDFLPKVKARLAGGHRDNTAQVMEQARILALTDRLVPDGTVVLLGDSIMQSLPAVALASGAVNYGVGGMSAAQLVQALPLFHDSIGRSRAIVLAVGINDFIQGTQPGLADHYKAILTAIPAEKPIVWSSIMPTARTSAAAIADANATIKRLCALRPRCAFVDTWPLMAPGGERVPSFYRDWVHLNGEGYRRWLPALRHALSEVNQPAGAT